MTPSFQRWLMLRRLQAALYGVFLGVVLAVPPLRGAVLMVLAAIGISFILTLCAYALKSLHDNVAEGNALYSRKSKEDIEAAFERDAHPYDRYERIDR